MGISVIGGGGAVASKTQKTQIITSTSSWVAPADVTQVEVWVFGGGGGGGGYQTTNFGWSGGGGGGGGCDHEILSVTPGTSYAVVIGGGGAGQASVSNNGPLAGHGSLSSFGGTMAIGYGGQGGAPSNASITNPGFFLVSSATTTGSGYTQDLIGSSGGGGAVASSSGAWAVAGGGGGAGGEAPSNGGFSTNSDFTIMKIGAYGQGHAGASGLSASATDGARFNGMGGRGIFGFGGGGGGAATAMDWAGSSTAWDAIYSNVRYRFRGIDGGGDGAMDIYNNAGGVAPAGQAQRLATSGAANRAGGGGGGCRTNWWTATGGNGGSGVVVIRFWSAL